ncbi:diguanylate cyclase [Aminobacter sp. AP02]|uniref:diguanylate cyclase domain-containing protein n=1 Tax=Aminobacter sp. AP02 TaxID=2135737 RepID=UPI001FE10930|nr:diguanylate cyclase [Aminobacter sp. AP02]
MELVSRIGGDEFAVLVGAQFDLAAVSELARDIIETLGRPIEHRGSSLRLGASVGIALFAQNTLCDLHVQADTALYAAKAAGRNTFRIFKPDDAGDMQNHRAA